jgi:hypothetical protein
MGRCYDKSTVAKPLKVMESTKMEKSNTCTSKTLKLFLESLWPFANLSLTGFIALIITYASLISDGSYV